MYYLLKTMRDYGVNSVFWHLGQGGKVSVLSFKYTDWPQDLQVYVPVPGFSPVVDIKSAP